MKSNFIIFNAESENQTLVGYLAAQKNSHYFGELKTLQKVNGSCIMDSYQLSDLLDKEISNHG